MLLNKKAIYVKIRLPDGVRINVNAKDIYITHFC